MSRRAKIRWISYFAAFCVAMISALAACHIGAGGFVTRIDAQSSRCFGETLNAVNKLDCSLRKSAFASGRSMKTILCAQIYSDAQSVQTSLSMLPVQLDALERISKQIAMMGDYAFSLAYSEAQGVVFSDDEIRQFCDFADFTESLRDQLETLRQAYEGKTLIYEQRLRLTDSLNNLVEQSRAATETLDEAFHRIQDDIPSVSVLSYDGRYNKRGEPFAGDLLKDSPVSQTQAAQTAAAFLGVAPNYLKPLDASEGEVPCWRFSVQGGLDGLISISVNGGHVVRYLTDTAASSEKSDRETNVKVCDAFLRSHGYPDMVEDETFAETENDAICFVSEQDGVRCLSDRIVMRVDPSTGEVISFNAEDYLKYHHVRKYPELNAELLLPSLPENASVQDVKYVLIQSPGGKECLCAEFLCRMPDGQTASVFVNDETGQQMRILLERETERSLF